jgi:hypothetical protein
LAAGEVGGWRGDLVERCDLRYDTYVGDIVSPDDVTCGNDQITSRVDALDADPTSPI